MARRGGFPGGQIPGGMNNMMKQAQRMQKQMEKKTQELEEKEWEASSAVELNSENIRKRKK